MNPLTIYCDARFTDDALAELKAGVGPHRLLLSDQPGDGAAAGTANPLLDRAEIAFGQPDAAQAMRLLNLKWIHLTTASYTRYDTPAFASAIRQRTGMLTSSSSVFAEACAEHALAFILSAARQFGCLQARQWPSERMREGARLLVGQTALLVGYGTIAARLAELLAPLKMTLIGIRRTPRGGESIRIEPMSEIDALLPLADHVVNILPAGPQTRQVFGAARFARMKPGAIFYNIGRGDTVDQSALRATLESGHLSAAWLDVTTPEPLPPEDPLWRARNCVITPHCAGGFDNELLGVVRHFLANLRRYESGQPLMDRVY